MCTDTCIEICINIGVDNYAGVSMTHARLNRPRTSCGADSLMMVQSERLCLIRTSRATALESSTRCTPVNFSYCRSRPRSRVSKGTLCSRIDDHTHVQRFCSADPPCLRTDPTPHSETVRLLTRTVEPVWRCSPTTVTIHPPAMCTTSGTSSLTSGNATC